MYRFGKSVDEQISELKGLYLGTINKLKRNIAELEASGGSSEELNCLIEALRKELNINLSGTGAEFGNRRMMARRRGRPRSKRGRGRGRGRR